VNVRIVRGESVGVDEAGVVRQEVRKKKQIRRPSELFII